MFFGASLYCGFNAIQSFAKGFKILKTTLQDVVSQESPQDQYFRGVIADEINAIVAENIEEVVQVDEMSQFTQFQKPTTFSEKVNSKSDFNEILVKKFRLTGVPAAQAIKSIAFENSKSIVKDLKSIVKNEYNLNPILDIKFIANGKVLSDFTQIAELNLRPSDVITVVGEQVGTAPYMRPERLENLIKRGLDEDSIIELLEKQFGSKGIQYINDYLKRSYQQVGVNTFEAARAKILNQPILNKRQQNGYDRALKIADERGLILVSDEYQYKLAVEEAQRAGKKSYDYAILEWKHSKTDSDKNEVCGHVWENSVRNIKRNVGACPICDSRLVNQKITNAIAKYIFDYLGYTQGNYKTEHSIIKIFPELKNSLHHAVHVDGYIVLNLRDKNGNQIKIAIEYQGQQHDPDPKIGFEAYKAITKNLDVQEGTQEFLDLKEEWESLLKRDRDKVILFNSENENGYYLIVVPHTVKAHERHGFIIKEFEQQTKIKLPYVPFKNWRLLKNLE